ncbi:6-carboxytetrahydropterin synthase QueD [Exiguobacterium sp. CH10]|uniref:6-carboxytetrahydropterin synthase QueD n=1 Tax=Exiguobacterium sp. CH10 TaxID=2751261 RepID=UPI001BE5FBB6|nr:6-carboxytetrahydropterin synthase QueD [Exiguobacterium sp. CH10]
MKHAPFLAPTSVESKQEGSLIYCPHRVQIVKEVTFDAAHHLFDYDGKCRALHGHTYKLQMGVSGFLDNRGMTLDFGDLKKIFKEELEPYLDHRYLNESLPYMNTTAENMCYWVFEQLATHLPNERDVRVEFVRLYETPTSYAEFRREWLVES